MSKRLIVPLVLAIALHGLSMQATSQATIDNGAGGKLVLVNITDAVVTNNPRAHVDLKIRVIGGDFLPSVSLNRGQEYQLKATENISYICMAYFGLEFAVFYPYVPKRDKGQAAVYWKVNELGFYISYDDGSKWKLDTRWETGK